MKYNVHIFAVVRVKVKDVEAKDHAEAIKLAVEQADLNTAFGNDPDITYTEDIDGYMVDEVDEKGEWVVGQYYPDAIHECYVNNLSPNKLRYTEDEKLECVPMKN